MISPIKATLANYSAISPVALNSQKAYRDNVNFNRLGEKLNINCNDNRMLVKPNGVGKNLDVIA